MKGTLLSNISVWNNLFFNKMENKMVKVSMGPKAHRFSKERMV